jgi:hypothetical protein
MSRQVSNRRVLTKPILIFIYNANSGVFNVLADIAHKIFSPETYSCNLCALTHSNFGMRQEWKDFIESLENPIEFLHSDELKKEYAIEAISLPAIFKKEEEKLKVWIDSTALNSCKTLDELMQLITNKLICDSRISSEKTSEPLAEKFS